MPATATKVSKRDALAVLKAILTTFPYYVCDTHPTTAAPVFGEAVPCDGMCAYPVARKTLDAKTYPEMDATPTLTDHNHEGLRPGCWSIFWEGNAPEDWVMSDALDAAVRKATDGRVFIEPINNCILGIFPA
jgi:hypothetical protein